MQMMCLFIHWLMSADWTCSDMYKPSQNGGELVCLHPQRNTSELQNCCCLVTSITERLKKNYNNDDDNNDNNDNNNNNNNNRSKWILKLHTKNRGAHKGGALKYSNTTWNCSNTQDWQCHLINSQIVNSWHLCSIISCMLHNNNNSLNYFKKLN